jgi:hypothetical protein
VPLAAAFLKKWPTLEALQKSGLENAGLLLRPQLPQRQKMEFR